MARVDPSNPRPDEARALGEEATPRPEGRSAASLDETQRPATSRDSGEEATQRPEARWAASLDETEDPDAAGLLSQEQTQSSVRARDPGLGRVARGTEVGRYVVLAELGAGAMGRVYAAYDPKLDRRVALKVLRLGHEDDEHHRRAERRLLGEAQALARLKHPHVVAVHDVETLRGSLVVAMDFIEGRTLGDWVVQGPRTWSEIVAVMIQAGEGLAAAHRAGLVHRDFKPDNVMVDADGQAHVVDFGLALAFEAASSVEMSVAGDSTLRSASAPRGLLTHTRGFAGTPAYMAPEQYGGTGVGPATDQFSFCVTLFEALWGRRPFLADTLASLSAAVLEGRVEPPPRDSEVPRRIRDAVLRGLATDASARHPDMDALLRELRFDPRARRRTMLRIGGVAALGAVAAFGYLGPTVDDAPQPCRDGATRIAEVWGDEDRDAVRSAVLASSRPFAAHGWQRASAELDAWAEQWAQAHDETCGDTWLRGVQSEQRLDLRMDCLDRHRQQLAAMVAVLREADDEVVERLVPMVAGLPPLSDCSDLDALTAAVPPPSDAAIRERVAAIRAALAHAHSLELAGKYEAARDEASAATDDAARLGYGPVHAEALMLRGYLEEKTGDAAAGERTLVAAAMLAERNRHDVIAARATSELTYVVGAELERIDDGLRWAMHADAAVGRLGDPLATARLHNNRGLVLFTAGRYPEAEAELRRALALRERELPPDHLEISSARNNLGNVLDAQGHLEQAMEAYERSLAERERLLGPDHPRFADLLVNMVPGLAAQGRVAQARSYCERGIRIYEAALGPVHPHLATAYNNLATTYFAEEDYEGGLAALERALAQWQQLRPPDHPDLGDAFLNLGALHFKLEHYPQARQYLERALAVYETGFGPEHPDVALALTSLGILDQNEGAFEMALQRHRRAVEIMRRTLHPQHPELVRALSQVARDAMGLEDHDAAIEAAREALAIADASPDVRPNARGQARFLLAQARWYAGRDRDDAVRAIRLAREEVLDDQDLRDEITEWLVEIGAEPSDPANVAPGPHGPTTAPP